MLPFHGGLLGEAMAADEEVTAAFLRYRLRGRNPAGLSAADDVAYWGDREILPHIFRFLSLRGVEAELRFGAGPIRFSESAANRKRAAVEARCAVLELAQGAIEEDMSCRRGAAVAG